MGDSITTWSFYNPTRVIFGESGFESIGDIVTGKSVVIVTSPGFRRRGLVQKVEKLLDGRTTLVLDTVTPNPSLKYINELRHIREIYAADSIIALGGGSSLDTAKALSRIIRLKKDEPISNLFSKDIEIEANRSVPVIAIPTTAGTGSEVTPTATIWDLEAETKRSLCGDDLYPMIALADPTLTYNLPGSITVSSGLDAISHALESVWNRKANPVSLMYATHSLVLSLDALPRLKMNGQDHQARSSMMQASLMAGLAISQTRTALSHSMSYPLTIKFGIPHGIACSFALPEILEFNASSDDGRLKTLVANIGRDTISSLGIELRKLLEQLLSDTDYSNEIAKIPLTLDFRRQMFTKGRAENNLRRVELDDLDGIIRNAVLRYEV